MKNGKKMLRIAIALACLLAGYGFGNVRVNDHRSDLTYKLHAAALQVPSGFMQAIAGEFKGLVADYLLLEAASFNGSRESFSAGPEDWDAVTRLLEQSNTLDPYFRSSYFLAQSALPWRAKKFDETFEILENSKKHLTWDWYPGYFLGFDHFYFLKDNLAASKELMEAAKIPDSPVYLATMGSRLAAEAGQIQVAIDFLTAMYETSEEETNKAQLLERIVALQGAMILEDAIRRFQLEFGRMPIALEELVSSSIIPSMPVNPYNKSYTMKDGRVKF